MSNETSVTQGIEGLNKTDPRTYTALQQLIDDVYRMYGIIFPSTSPSTIKPSSGVIPGDVTGIVFTPFPTNLRIDWNEAIDAQRYEIREGTVWDTATYIITTTQLVANLDPIVNNLTIGNHTFLIKAISVSGDYSIDPAVGVFTVQAIPAPILSGSVISNNAILSWTEPPSTWAIDYYILRRNAIEVGYIDGNFAISSEIVAGLYSYTIQAFDIVGNSSPESTALTLQVDNPIDLVFIQIINALLNGTYVNTFRGINQGIDGVFGAYPVPESYEQHFLSHGYNSPQDQVSAGYPEWLSPTGTNGSYREVFDFGAIYSNVTINVTYSKLNVFGSTSVSTTIEYSTDNVTWTAPITGTVVFAANFRYVRITWNFVNSDQHSLAFIYFMKVSLNVQLTLDSDNVTIYNDTIDPNGTLVTFHKVFKSVNSVTLTSGAFNPVDLVYSNVGTTNMRVFAFDNAGQRLTIPISWKVRGVT